MRKDLLCKDCKWSEIKGIGYMDAPKGTYKEHYCMNPETFNPDLVRGNHRPVVCGIARDIKAACAACGPDGNLWEAKE